MSREYDYGPEFEELWKGLNAATRASRKESGYKVFLRTKKKYDVLVECNCADIDLSFDKQCVGCDNKDSIEGEGE